MIWIDVGEEETKGVTYQLLFEDILDGIEIM